MKRKYWLGLSVAAALVGGTYAYKAYDRALPQAQEAGIHQNAGIFASNFKPGTNIDYTIFALDGETVKGKNAIAENGALEISDQKLSALGRGPVSYDFAILPPGTSKAANLRVILDEKSGTIKFSGQGLKKFSDISLSHENTQITAKTDWAGKFQKAEAFDFTRFRPEKLETFQLAFMGDEFAIGANRESPNIIKILFAPGGGRAPDHTWENPDSNGLLRPNPENNIYDLTGAPFTKWVGEPARAFPYKTNFENIMYFETWCGDKPVIQLSVCQNPAMTQQIIDVVENYVAALIKMTEQLTAVMMKHVQVIGTMIDAKMQLETEREIQALVANAHKTYHPSDQMCQFGTFVRSLADTEERMKYNKIAFNKAMMSTYTGSEDRSTSEGYAVDIEARIDQFKQKYCDPEDNNNGLARMCTNPGDEERFNKDIDYIRTIDTPLTLKVDFTDSQLEEEEEDIFALARNLYWPRALEGGMPKEMKEHYADYMGWRNLAAVNNVAHNSFAQIMAMKSQADPNDPTQKGGHFMKILMSELGGTLADDEYLGENPSYYAQMEVLTKKIYQNPDFYTNLYDKPDNVRRINVTLEAIKNMQTRDRFEAALRREMLISQLVEQAIAKHVEATNALIKSKGSAVGRR